MSLREIFILVSRPDVSDDDVRNNQQKGHWAHIFLEGEIIMSITAMITFSSPACRLVFPDPRTTVLGVASEVLLGRLLCYRRIHPQGKGVCLVVNGLLDLIR
ncbi:hypothetical protein J6590_000520 [Homalodisca vitripennis]|nr:hypothetical protein J6590_000520 [Homalodisca vitripennis]